jgi:hypothetical protein
VLLEYGLDFSGDQGVIRLPLSRWCLLPVLPGVVTAAGHSQPAAEPGDGVLIGELIDQAKPLGGSCSLAKETLENPANLRENWTVIAGQDWVDGWQAARLHGLRAHHGQEADQTGEVSL